MDSDEIDELVSYNLSYDISVVDTLTMINRLDLLTAYSAEIGLG